jgi:hypothetical protein
LPITTVIPQGRYGVISHKQSPAQVVILPPACEAAANCSKYVLLPIAYGQSISESEILENIVFI